MIDNDSTLDARVDAHHDLRDHVAHDALTDATVLVGPDVRGTGTVSLVVLSDGQAAGYDLRPGDAAGLAVDLRDLAAEAREALLDPEARQPLTSGRQLERYLAHTRRTAVVTRPGQAGWLAARLPWSPPDPEPLVLLGARPTLVLTGGQAVRLAYALDVHAASATRSGAGARAVARGEYHDVADFSESYRDALDFLETTRNDDGHAAGKVEERTPCGDCLLHSVAEIGWRLGDRRQTEQAADGALQHLARLAAGDV